MRPWMFLTSIIFSLVFFVACGGSNNLDTEEHMHGEEAMGSMQTSDAMKSSEEWIRLEPVDVKAVDGNRDGFVYQDPMDWNVIADEEGKCPKCGMFLKKVTIEEAEKNLRDNGFVVN